MFVWKNILFTNKNTFESSCRVWGLINFQHCETFLLCMNSSLISNALFQCQQSMNAHEEGAKTSIKQIKLTRNRIRLNEGHAKKHTSEVEAKSKQLFMVWQLKFSTSNFSNMNCGWFKELTQKIAFSVFKSMHSHKQNISRICKSRDCASL